MGKNKVQTKQKFELLGNQYLSILNFSYGLYSKTDSKTTSHPQAIDYRCIVYYAVVKTNRFMKKKNIG